MKREMFFAISGAIGILFGLGFLLMPDASLRSYGVPTEPHNLMQARYFGSALLTVGLVYFLARDTQDVLAVKAMLIAGVIGNAVGGVISVAAIGGLQNDLVWLSVAIYFVFAAAAAWYLVQGRKPAQVQSA
jgi:hypothetical protein